MNKLKIFSSRCIVLCGIVLLFAVGVFYHPSKIEAASIPTVVLHDYKVPNGTTIKGTGVTYDSPAVWANDSAVSSAGVIWSTSPNPTVSLSTKSVHEYLPNYLPNGNGSSGESITGLLANTTYYVRGYAVNGIGVGYSDSDLIIKTGLPNLQVVVNNPASSTNTGSVYGFTATIKNAGLYPVDAPIDNMLQVASGPDGSGSTTEYRNGDPETSEVRPVSSGSIWPGNSVSVNSGISSTSTGFSFRGPRGVTQSFRVCADQTVQRVVESNEGDNCSPWYNVFVKRIPDVIISASPTGGSLGLNSTISWNVQNAVDTTCTASGDWSGSKIFYSSESTGSLNTTKTYSYTLTCTNPDGSASNTATVTVCSSGLNWNSSTSKCEASFPDLAIKKGVTPTTFAYDGGQTLLQVSLSNIGPGPISNSTFPVLGQWATGIDGSGNGTDIMSGGAYTSIYPYNISSGSDYENGMYFRYPVDIVRYTVPGISYFRACADKSSASDTVGVISESNENNNCGPWTRMSITKPEKPDLYPANEPMNYRSDSLQGHVLGTGYVYEQSIKNEGTISIPSTTVPKHLFQTAMADVRSDGTWDGVSVWNLKNYQDSNYAITYTGHPNTYLPAGETRLVRSPVITESEYDYFMIRLCADKSSVSDVDGIIDETNENNNCTPWQKVSFSNPPKPDIRSSSITPVIVAVNTAQNFSAEISNHGTVATNYSGVNSFQNFFQTADTFDLTNGVIDYSKPVNLVDYSTSPTTTLVRVLKSQGSKVDLGGGNIVWEDRADIYEQDIKFTSIGKRYIRVCSDKSSRLNAGVIPESDENNNCGSWTEIAVTDSNGLSGTLSGVDCRIKKGESTCKTDLTLSITNPVTSASTNITKLGNIEVANGITPSIKSGIEVGYPNTIFYLNHDGKTLNGGGLKVSATCVAGSGWDINSKTCELTTAIDGYWTNWLPGVNSCPSTITQNRTYVPAKNGGIDDPAGLADGTQTRTINVKNCPSVLNMDVTFKGSSIRIPNTNTTSKIPYNSKVNVSWSSSNIVEGCTCEYIDSKNNKGSCGNVTENKSNPFISAALKRDTTYTVSCVGEYGIKDTDSVKVLVSPMNPGYTEY